MASTKMGCGIAITAIGPRRGLDGVLHIGRCHVSLLHVPQHIHRFAGTSTDTNSVWSCDRSIHPDKCSFFLWEDHLVEALKYHEVPEDQIIKATPKRKRDGDIRELLLRSPKTPRTREPRAEDGEEDDLYGSPSPSPSPSPRSRQGEESNRRRGK